MDKKKVLILAYDFPPYVSVGALRPSAWLKYFPENGIYPIVVTRQWSNLYKNHLDYIAPSESLETKIESSSEFTVIRSPYLPNIANRLLLRYGNTRFKLFRKCISAYYEIMQYFFVVGPKKQIYRAAKQYLKNNPVDVIIATGEPFVLFKYAANLSKKFQIPWVADYRDPWSQDKDRDVFPGATTINKFVEKLCLKSASAICTVSPFFQEQIESLIKNKPFWIIPNGYDSEIPLLSSENKQNGKIFSIALAGTISDWHPVASFLSVLSKTLKIDTIDAIDLHLYGINKTESIERLLVEQFPDLRNRLTIHARLQNIELARQLSSHNCLLLFNNYTNIGTKIYDYLALRRKIMFCYTNDFEAEQLRQQYFNIESTAKSNDHLQADLIQKTNSGVLVRDAQHLEEVLLDLYAEFKQNGYIQCDSVGIEELSRQSQTKVLAENLLELINNQYRERN